MNDKMKLSIALMSLPLFFVGCATAPKGPPTGTASFVAPKTFLFQTAQWESTAQIKNFENGGMNHLEIDVLGIRNNSTRIEVVGAFGTPVASVYVSESEFRLGLHTEKKFFYGPNRPGALSSVADLPLDPRDLVKFIFDELPVSAGWRCYVGKDQMLSKCLYEAKKVSVLWTERKEGAKRISILAPQFEMSWYFKSPKTNIQLKPIQLELKRPPTYSQVQL